MSSPQAIDVLVLQTHEEESWANRTYFIPLTAIPDLARLIAQITLQSHLRDFDADGLTAVEYATRHAVHVVDSSCAQYIVPSEYRIIQILNALMHS